MKEYLKMEDGFDLDEAAIERRLFGGCICKEEATYAAHAIISHDELVAEVDRLRRALTDAATSLETIHMRSHGEDSFLDSKHQMRSYAESRAKVARQALSEQ